MNVNSPESTEKYDVVTSSPVCNTGVVNWRVLCLLAALVPGLVRSETLLLDGVAAYVNEHVITIGDVELHFSAQRVRLMRQYKDSELELRLGQAYRQSLETLVQRRLVLSEYKRRVAAGELQIPDFVIEERAEALLQRNLGDDRDALNDVLVHEGMTLDELKQPFRDRVIISILGNIEVQSRVVVTPQEVRRQYLQDPEKYEVPARIDLGVIVIHLDDEDENRRRMRVKADLVRQDLAEGADFEQTAKIVSQGRKADTGGAWGWYEPGDLREELFNAVAGLAAGQLSPVTEIGDDLYIMKVKQRRESHVREFGDVQKEIEARLREKKISERHEEWMSQLRSRAYLKIVDPRVSGTPNAPHLSSRNE